MLNAATAIIARRAHPQRTIQGSATGIESRASSRCFTRAMKILFALDRRGFCWLRVRLGRTRNTEDRVYFIGRSQWGHVFRDYWVEPVEPVTIKIYNLYLFERVSVSSYKL